MLVLKSFTVSAFRQRLPNYRGCQRRRRVEAAHEGPRNLGEFQGEPRRFYIRGVRKPTCASRTEEERVSCQGDENTEHSVRIGYSHAQCFLRFWVRQDGRASKLWHSMLRAKEQRSVRRTEEEQGTLKRTEEEYRTLGKRTTGLLSK